MEQLDVAKWLYSLEDYDHVHSVNEPFQRACRRGHIKTAQWLHSIADYSLVEILKGFRDSALMDDLNMCKWLYFTGLIVDVNFNAIFERNHAR